MPLNPSAAPPGESVFSVSRLNREARRLLETGLPGIWVGGEISNLVRPGSGHLYFSLKDANAQVRCAMFRGKQRNISFAPEDGMEVVLQGVVSIYEARGSYQIIVEQMEEAGEGKLRRAFEALKARLDKEGLFAAEHKRALPRLPSSIGVITSPTGAAVRDVLKILRRRYPIAQVIVYPTRVQGAGAAEEIAAAIDTAARRKECDVLILTRGGGSLEDLWSFNEEVVARAVYSCPIPLVAGVGHEIDISIADLVADVRAPTPSGAAELIVPERDGLLQQLRDRERRAALALKRHLQTVRTGIQQQAQRLRRVHPGAVLRQSQQRVDELVRLMVQHVRRQLAQQSQGRAALMQRLTLASPQSRISQAALLQSALTRRLQKTMVRLLRDQRRRLSAVASGLNAVSPLATLERGYAIVNKAGSKTLLRDAGQLKPGDAIEARLASGVVDATVTRTRKPD